MNEPSPTSRAGASVRAKLIASRMPDVVKQHRLAPEGAVIVVITVDQLTALPLGTEAASHDRETALAVLSAEVALEWLGAKHDVSKWQTRDPEAMDVAVVTADGATILRLTAR